MIEYELLRQWFVQTREQAILRGLDRVVPVHPTRLRALGRVLQFTVPGTREVGRFHPSSGPVLVRFTGHWNILVCHRVAGHVNRGARALLVAATFIFPAPLFHSMQDALIRVLITLLTIMVTFYFLWYKFYELFFVKSDKRLPIRLFIYWVKMLYTSVFFEATIILLIAVALTGIDKGTLVLLILVTLAVHALYGHAIIAGRFVDPEDKKIKRWEDTDERSIDKSGGTGAEPEAGH